MTPWSGKYLSLVVGLLLLCHWPGSLLSAAEENDASLAGAKATLWRSHAEPPKDVTASAKLEEAIRKLQAIELKPQRPTPASAPSERPPQPSTMPAQAGAPPRPDPEMLGKLRQISTEGLTKAAELADALYLAVENQVAEAFYQRALGTADEAAERAWLMFQLANCKKQTDPDLAKQLYGQLAEEYTDSSWRPVALMGIRLIEWEQINQPKELIAQVKAEIEKVGLSVSDQEVDESKTAASGAPRDQQEIHTRHDG